MIEESVNGQRPGLAPTPRSLIDGGPTRLWHHIPGDHQRPSRRETFDLYWDDVNGFGMVHPRAKDPWETLAYYQTEGARYYTHADPQDAVKGTPASTQRTGGLRPFLARLLMRLAWSQDWGVPFSGE
ncbi:MAG TPA: hypothetical protein VFF52_05830, partial [Isosphaeraceae bacterium]|nr:hypothetical protein [Isosphaeraceae bacterium]